MTDLQRAARTVVTAKLIADVVGVEESAAKVAVDEAMTALGVERLRVTDDDGNDAGTLTRASRRPAARVVDEAAFTAWVAVRYPDEMVQQVRPAFRDRLLHTAAGRGEPVDSQGEVIPGVDVVAGQPYVSCRPSAAGRERMRDLLVSSGLLALRVGPNGSTDGDSS